MKNRSKIEVFISIVLVVLSILILNPFRFWMPDMILLLILAITFVVFAMFSIFLIHEKIEDERIVLHRMLAGRMAFLAGSTVLLAGIIVQALSHEVDVWLVIALVAMVLSKLIARIYSDSNL